MGNRIVIDPTRIYAWISTDNKWGSASDSCSVCIPVTVGRSYTLQWTNTNSDNVGTIYRYGFSNSGTPSSQTLTQCTRTTPQDASPVTLTADRPYLVMQLSGSKFPGNLAYLVVEEVVSNADYILRRRAMMTGIVLPEWDYEWAYNVDNCYPSQKGWTKTVGGNGKEQKTSSGYYQMVASGTDGYIQYSWPSAYSKGVLRIQFRLAGQHSSTLRIYLSNGTSAIGVRPSDNNTASNQKFYLMDGNSGYSSMTALANFKSSNTYWLELILDNGYGTVRMQDYTGGGDWQTIASGVDCSEIVSQQSMGTATTAIRMSPFASSSNAWTIYKIQMKFGRTS